MAQQTVFVTNHQTGLLDILAQMVAADAGLTDKWTNTGNEMVLVNNAGVGSITVTYTLPAGAGLDGLVPAARVHTIVNGKWALLGPLPSTYNDASGNVTLTWSAVTSVKLLVFLRGT